MKICHVGTIGFESKSNARELKAIGGISAYTFDLIEYSLNNHLEIIFVGKIYNFEQSNKIRYHQVQNKLTSTNKFLLHLFFKSLFIRLSKDIILHAHRPDHLAASFLFKNYRSILTLHGQQAHTVNIRKGKVISA